MSHAPAPQWTRGRRGCACSRDDDKEGRFLLAPAAQWTTGRQIGDDAKTRVPVPRAQAQPEVKDSESSPGSSSLVWYGFVWSGRSWSGLVWPGRVWPGLAWSGLVWSSLAWSPSGQPPPSESLLGNQRVAQKARWCGLWGPKAHRGVRGAAHPGGAGVAVLPLLPVSYTHLTLPTICSV